MAFVLCATVSLVTTFVTPPSSMRHKASPSNKA